jgi:acetyl esterase
LQYEELSDLAPALIQTAGFDPLKDEADAYAARLTEAGVEVELIDYPGMIHGFMRAIGVVDVAQLAIDEAAVVFRKAFGSA